MIKKLSVISHQASDDGFKVSVDMKNRKIIISHMGKEIVSLFMFGSTPVGPMTEICGTPTREIYWDITGPLFTKIIPNFCKTLGLDSYLKIIGDNVTEVPVRTKKQPRIPDIETELL